MVVATKYKAVASAKPEVAMAVQLLPSVDHCHTPSIAALELLALIATPAKVLAELPPVTASLASLKLAPNKLVTDAPAGLAVSSLTGVKVTTSLPATTVGASLTTVTLVLKVTEVALK